jgi:hypothetical protein
VVQIDFLNKTIKLISPSTPDINADKIHAIAIGFPNGIPTVKGKVVNNKKESSWEDFEIDTGSNGGILLSEPFQDRNRELNIEKGHLFAAKGIGGEQATYDGRCSAFYVGNICITESAVELASDNQGFLSSATGGRLGNAFWKQFNLTINYPEGLLYLNKNSQGSEISR